MSDVSDLVFIEQSHEYFLRGRKIPSVTQLLSPLYAEAFANIPRAALDAKAAIGTAVHLATELYDEGDLDEASLHPTVRAYLDGWKRFRDELTPDGFTAAELRRAHPLLGYAGTVDRELTWRGRPAVLDIKTTVLLYPAVGPQLSAYAMLASHSQDEQYARLAVQLTEDGRYNVHEYKDPIDRSCFLSLLTIHNWKAKTK